MSDANPETADPALTRNGGVSYLHIPAVDPRRAAEFYAAVFGWDVNDVDGRRPSFVDPTGQIAGAWMAQHAVSTEPGLLPYIYVDALDATVAAIAAHGGEIVDPPYVEGTLRVGTFRDPEGNVMGLCHETAV